MIARVLAWLRKLVHGRCGSTFETAFHEELRCELAHGHRGPHRAVVRTSFDREYRYDWTYPWDFERAHRR